MITLRPGFVLLVALIVFFDEGLLLFIIWTAALLHELGHYAALRLTGGRLERIVLDAGGVTMVERSYPALSPARQAAAVLAGPVTSLCFALLFSLWGGGTALALGGMCLTQALFNLCPVRGLDGGRLLVLALDSLGFRHSRLVLTLSSLLTAVLLAAAGLVYCRRMESGWMMMASVLMVCLPLAFRTSDIGGGAGD